MANRRYLTVFDRTIIPLEKVRLDLLPLINAGCMHMNLKPSLVVQDYVGFKNMAILSHNIHKATRQ
jgi:hypothetical protein